MPKKNRIRGNLRKNDAWRVVLTDTAPFEVPVIFSNDGFYKNLQDLPNKSGKMQNLLENLFASHKPEPRCYLVDLYTTPDLRGGGIGRTLIEGVYEIADKDGCSQVYWMTQDFNEAGRRLYDKVARLTPFIKYQS